MFYRKTHLGCNTCYVYLPILSLSLSLSLSRLHNYIYCSFQNPSWYQPSNHLSGDVSYRYTLTFRSHSLSVSLSHYCLHNYIFYYSKNILLIRFSVMSSHAHNWFLSPLALQGLSKTNSTLVNSVHIKLDQRQLGPTAKTRPKTTPLNVKFQRRHCEFVTFPLVSWVRCGT